MISIKNDTIEFARYHILMMFILFVFFGFLILPVCLTKIKSSKYSEVEAMISKVLFNQKNVSFVELQIISSNDRVYRFNELIPQSLKKNDVIVVYVNKDHNHILLSRPNNTIYIIIIFFYFFIMLAILIVSYDVFVSSYLFNKQQTSAKK